MIECMDAPAGETVLAHVRRVTRSAHEAIEGSLGLMGDTITISDYKNVLLRLYSFWNTWEPQISSLIEDEAFLAPRRRKHLLVADLAALGVNKRTLDELSPCPVTRLAGQLNALGSLYVMEGSSLGGRQIQRNVELRLGVTARPCTSYFKGYGDQTGPMWKSFTTRLDKIPSKGRCEVADGAIATFNNLREWLTAP
jgi:heme oxygenase